MKLEKGVVFKIDRFRDGEIAEYKVMRLCRKFITVRRTGIKHEKGFPYDWAMPYDRIKDAITN